MCPDKVLAAIFMKDVRGLYLFLVVVSGRAHRSIRIDESRDQSQQQRNTLAVGLGLSADAREAFIPGGFGTRVFPRAGRQARPLRGWDKQDGWPVRHFGAHRGAPFFRLGPRVVNVALQAASDPKEDQSPPKEDLAGDGGCLLQRCHLPLSRGDLARVGTYARVAFRATLAETGTLLAEDTITVRVGTQPSEAVPGWDLALPTMRVGDKVRLLCAPGYAWGEAGKPPCIPPNATVRFDLTLMDVRDLMSSHNPEEVDMVNKFCEYDAAALKSANPERAAAPQPEAKIVDVEEEYRAAKRKRATDLKAKSGRPSKPPTDPAQPAGSAQPGPSSHSQKTDKYRRVWMPDATLLRLEAPWGRTRETEEEIEVEIPLPDGATHADVDVEISATAIRVAILGEVILEGPTVGPLRAEDSSWSLRPAEGGLGFLELDLVKKVPGDQRSLWGYILQADHDASGDPD